MPDAESLQWMIIMAVCALVFVVSIARLVWVLFHGPSPSTSRQRTWSDPEPTHAMGTVAAMSFLGNQDGVDASAPACDTSVSDSSCSSSNL